MPPSTWDDGLMWDLFKFQPSIFLLLDADFVVVGPIEPNPHLFDQGLIPK